MRKSFWTGSRILLLIMAGALIIRILATLTRDMVQFDETAYLRMAENLLAGKGPLDVTGLTSTLYAPLLPLFIAGVSLIAPDTVTAGYVVVIVFGVLLLLPVYLLGREFFNERVGLMAAALMAVAPIFIGTAEYIYSEGLYIFFLLMALFFGWHALKGKSVQCGAAAGVSVGLAYLANPSALFYLAALLVLAAVIAIKTDRRLDLAKSTGVLVLGFLVFCVPYVLFLHAELGRWTYTGKSTGGNIYVATHDIRREDTLASEKALLSLTGEDGEPLVLALERQGNDPVSFVLGSPVDAGKNFLKQVFAFHKEILGQVLPLWLLPLFGLGLFSRAWSPSRARAIGYLGLMTAPVLLVLFMYAHARFFMPYLPLAMIVVAAGWERLEVWMRETAQFSLNGSWRERWLRWMPWVIGAAVLLPLMLYSGLMVKKQNYETQYREAGLWLAQNGGYGSRIMDRNFSTAYYAGATAVVLPYADYASMTGYARRQDVDYLIVERRSFTKYRPEQVELLEDADGHPDWRLMHVIRPGTSAETLIFELVK